MLAPVDYAKVAQGFGARGVGVRNPHELTAATRQALTAGQPMVIEVPLPLLGPADLTSYALRNTEVTHVAPDIREQILFLPRTQHGRDPIGQRNLRPIAAVDD